MTETLQDRTGGGSGRLAGRRIVVSGAASGIGAATARLFAREGASLALIDANAEALSQVAREARAHAYVADVTDERAVADAARRAAAAMGGLDGVVTAAGIMWRGSILDVDAAAWRRVIDVNLTGTYLVARACAPWLKQATDASIVTLGSGQGLLPNVADRTAYAASKGGVVNLTRALAAELAPTIRANCVCPGLVDTPMADGVRGNTANYALRRIADPQEIALAILYLTSAEASYVTGAILAVDGGRSFH